MAGRPTMTLVAEELGVSPMTVSNAFNHPERLSPALRKRVLETARRLHYPGPDPLGRGLRRGRVGAVGVLYDNLLSYAFADAAAVDFLRGLSVAAEDEGLSLTLVPGSPRGDRDPAVIGDVLVDGFVVYSVADGDPVLQAALDRGLPTVIVDQPRVDSIGYVGIDDEGACRQLAQHLLDLGHRRFGVVSFGLLSDGFAGLADPARQARASYPVSRARLRGYAAPVEAAGLRWADVPVYEGVTSSGDVGRAGAEVLLAHQPRPTALLATSDALAIGALDVARERGLRVPADLSVVGFDDTPEAAASTPPLTTVAQNHFDKGALAGRLFLAQLRGPTHATAEPPADQIIAPTRLVMRGSTGPPADPS